MEASAGVLSSVGSDLAGIGVGGEVVGVLGLVTSGLGIGHLGLKASALKVGVDVSGLGEGGPLEGLSKVEGGGGESGGFEGVVLAFLGLHAERVDLVLSRGVGVAGLFASELAVEFGLVDVFARLGGSKGGEGGGSERFHGYL